MERLRLRKGGRVSRVHAKCHGLSRVVSRVGREKRPVFIRLSRCHGSTPSGTGITKHPPSPRGFGAASQHRPSLGGFGPASKVGEPPSLGSFRRRWEAVARQAGAPSKVLWNGLERSKFNIFDMWANIPIMSYINLRKFFGRSPDFHNSCLSQIDFAVFLEFLIKRRLSRFSMGIFQAGCAVSTLAVRWRALSEVWTGALRRPRRRAKRRSF